MDMDSVPFHNLSLGHDGQKMEEPVEVVQSLVLPPTDMRYAEGIVKDDQEGKTKNRQRWSLDYRKKRKDMTYMIGCI